MKRSSHNFCSKLFLIAAFPMFLFISSCDHETDPFDGPGLVDRFGPFLVEDSLSASTDSVDFRQGQNVVFSGRFNKNIEWIIKIEGLETGAVRLIEGRDRFIGLGNANWDGGASEPPFFGVENCRVSISVPEEPDFGDTLDVAILGTKVYEGAFLTDFEASPGANIIVRDFQFELNVAETGRRDASVIPPAQGEFSLVITGSDNAQDPFVGLIEVYSQLSGNTYMQLPSSNPESIFFNCFLYSDGRPYAIAILDLVADSNDDGVFNPSDAIYSTGPIPVTWTGWRSFSRTLAEFGIPESDMGRILLSRVVLINDIANNPNSPGPPDEVQYGVDFMIFTQDAPLNL